MSQPDPLPDFPIDVLADDGDLIVVDKPSGVVVHRGWNDADRPMLQRVRDQVGSYVYLIHRLDRATSGVLLFARTQETASRLGQAFEAGEVRKEYVALVRGHFGRRYPEARSSAGLHVDYAVPRTENGERIEAQTDFFEISEHPSERASLVRAMPRTGRFHQIRRHLKHLRHPIIGDVRYGDGKVNRFWRETHELQRLALHARSIQIDGRTFEAPLPEWAATLTSP